MDNNPPPGLAEFAETENLSGVTIGKLAQARTTIRGHKPTTPDEWRSLWNAIKWLVNWDETEAFGESALPMHLVFAYNRLEFERWCRQCGLRPTNGNVRYIYEDRQLRGNINYHVVFLSGWWERRSNYEFDPDLMDIICVQADATHHPGSMPVIANGKIVAWRT